MDQGDPVAWTNFFEHVTLTLDIMIDDGGHKAPKMVTTIEKVWPHLKPGGIMATENILGVDYLQSFFVPAAKFYGARSHELAIVSIYPLLLIVEKLAVGQRPPASRGQSTMQVHVKTMDALNAAVESAPPGSIVVLENKAWGTFFFHRSIDKLLHFLHWLTLPKKD